MVVAACVCVCTGGGVGVGVCTRVCVEGGEGGEGEAWCTCVRGLLYFNFL